MTLDRLLLAGNLAAIIALIWLGWWLTRPAKPRRGGYLHDHNRR